MTKVSYEIVQHDGGWAYKAQGSYSETFTTREQAVSAAHRAANEQQVAGETAAISFEDERGKWHSEVSEGTDRPEAEVKDD